MAFTYNPLWKTLVDKNMNKEDLRKLINVSPSTMAKMSKNEYVAMRVLDDICKALNIESISEIVECELSNKKNKEINKIENLEKLVNDAIINNQHDHKTQGDIYRMLYSLLSKFSSLPYYNKEKRKVIEILLKCIINQILTEDKDVITLTQMII